MDMPLYFICNNLEKKLFGAKTSDSFYWDCLVCLNNLLKTPWPDSKYNYIPLILSYWCIKRYWAYIFQEILVI